MSENLHPPAPSASPASAIELWARRLGLALGPLAFLLIQLLAPESTGLTPAGRSVLAIAAWMAMWWLSEAIPLAATALLPLVLLPLTGATSPAQAAAPYADELIFLFLGGFLLGIALEVTGLHRRVALCVLLFSGTGTKAMIGAVMLVAACISMFVSNTATAVMLTPLALSLVALVEDRARSHPLDFSRHDAHRFAASMMLGVAFAASIGGMGTIIGTPPNVITTAYIAREGARSISFGQWMLVCVPVVLIILPLTWFMLTHLVFRLRATRVPGGREFVRDQWRALGSASREQFVTFAVFCATVTLWIFRQPIALATGLVDTLPSGRIAFRLTDAAIAIGAAILLFALPLSLRGPSRRVLSWSDASRIPWGVLLLFGGGLSIAAAMGTTHLDAFIAAQFNALSGMPEWLILLIVCAGVVAFSELAGNTAVATTVVPILGAAAPRLGIDPVKLLLATSLACSCGFMLPVSTPPNAIVFASGRVSIHQMMRAGLGLDLLCVLVIVFFMSLAGDPLLRFAGLLSP